jgi:NADP-dependent aldehyde dehydrogenase
MADKTFLTQPSYGPAFEFCSGTVKLVNRACEAAEEAFWSYGYSSRSERAGFLEAVADEIKALPKAIMSIASQETGLPDARLSCECKRTTGQLRLFATHIRQGDYLDRRHARRCRSDSPSPDRSRA